MTDPKLKKIEGIDEDWQRSLGSSDVIQDQADQVAEDGAPGLFTNLVRMSVAGIAGLRFSGRTG